MKRIFFFDFCATNKIAFRERYFKIFCNENFRLLDACVINFGIETCQFSQLPWEKYGNGSLAKLVVEFFV